MSVDCSASGNPEPDENVIGPDGMHLDKKGFVLKKFGTYRCEASNVFGNASLNITISEAKGMCSSSPVTILYLLKCLRVNN